MTAEQNLRHEMLASIPNLRAFAISLTGNQTQADDLLQTTLLKALENFDKFEAGTNMRAWLFTILRNQFYTDIRKHRREVEDPDGIISGKVGVLPAQGSRLDLTDMQQALTQLSPEQRETLLLVAAEGASYEEVARITGTNLGTVKSRVNRARNRLAEILGVAAGEDFGPDRLARAALPAHSTT